LPLGWGPYILKGWTPGDRIVAERNPDYFRADEGLPFFDRLVFRFAGADVERNLTDLQAGRCDLLTLDTYLDAQLARVLELEEAGALELYANPGRVWEHLDFGINPSPDVDRPDYFEDARMRQAVAHCVDRQRLVDQVHGGLTIVPHAYIPPAHPLSAQADLPEYPFDPELGMGLLEAMGWRDYDGDGVREAHGVEGIPDGARLQFSYETTTSQQRAQIAGLIAEDLATCGIVVTVVQTPPSEFFAETPFAPLYGRRFDLVQFAWFTGSIPPCDLFLSDGLRSEAGAGADQGATGYTNPAYDVACRAAMAALPGTEDYTVHHLEALRIFARDLPVLSLAMRPYLSAARPELLGLLLDSSEMAETWSIEEFRLEP
jgi:peptide/nickel transport system substrate-binding protein